MFKNKIAMKLSVYFAVALLAFALAIGSIFVHLLRNNTISLHKTQLSSRAESIAATLSDFMSDTRGHGMMGFGAYLSFIRDIAGTDVWIVDRDLTLITHGGGGMMHNAHDYQYSDLPENADRLVKEVFNGQTVFSEDFSGLLSEASLTVGVPIQGGDDIVVGVVLLHSPINGINSAVWDGVRMLAVSLGIALVIAFLLSIWLSRHFTNPIIQKEAHDAIRLERIRREFIANISHELKTPITVIRGSLEALIDQVVSDPEQMRAYHRQMLREAFFLQRLVGDLLDLSKLQNTEFVIEKQDISLYDLMDDVVRSIKPVAAKKEVMIAIVKEKEEINVEAAPVLFGDYGRIRQMLLIILDNAVKFSPDADKVTITLTGSEIAIHDNGPGIEEDELPMIFERFYKSRSEQNKTGTGLGLAIAKQIAERHDMAISVRNNKEGGTTFLIKCHKTENKKNNFAINMKS